MIDLAGTTSDLVTTRGGARDSRSLQRDAARGRLVRVAHGAYVDAARWATAMPSERFVYRIAAAQKMAPRPIVFSHVAAAVLWGLPWWGAPPTHVDVTTSSARTSRTHHLTRVHAHALGDDAVAEIDGIRLTKPARTCADVLLGRPRLPATVVVDGALHQRQTTAEEVRAVLAGQPGRRGLARAARTLAFCVGDAESAGESVSRVVIDDLGFPPPVLQRRWQDSRGLIGFTDMWWPTWGLIGEYDGDVKYLSDRYRNGRTPEQVVLDEKRREDRLRAVPGVRQVVRWNTADLRRPERLRRLLREAGLPEGR